LLSEGKRSESFRERNQLEEILSSGSFPEIIEQIQFSIVDNNSTIRGRYHALVLLRNSIQNHQINENLTTNMIVEWIQTQSRIIFPLLEKIDSDGILQEQYLNIILGIIKNENEFFPDFWRDFFLWISDILLGKIPEDFSTIQTSHQRRNIKILRVLAYSIRFLNRLENGKAQILVKIIGFSVENLQSFLSVYKGEELNSLVGHQGIYYAPSQFMYLNILVIFLSFEQYLETHGNFGNLFELFPILNDLDSTWELFDFWSIILQDFQDDELIRILCEGIKIYRILENFSVIDSRTDLLLKLLNPHQWFYLLMKQIDFNSTMILDMLVSGETVILEYLLS
jgi:hypothetical protein